MPLLDPKQLALWTGGRWQGGLPAVINGVSTDSRTLVPGRLFIAIRGPRFDGHRFVAQAFEKGAVGALVDKAQFPVATRGPLLCVEDAATALRQAAAAYRREIGLKIIAITGSVGKTTVKEMIADVFAFRCPTARTPGNWNNDLGLPLSLLGMERSVRVGVFEMAMNHPGELAPLCRLLRPDWGVITTIGPVHLEFFSSVESIAREKAELLKCLPAGGVAVLQKDNAWFELLSAAASCRVVTVALEGPADYLLDSGYNLNGEVKIIEKGSGEFVCLRMPLPGRHNILNVLFAVAVARCHGLNWDDIRYTLERYKTQPMRWQCETVAGVMVINDAYNANPLSMAAALQTFSELKASQGKWLVLAGMLELGTFEKTEHVNLGKKVASGPWRGLITIGPLGRIIAKAAQHAGLDSEIIFDCENHEQAIQALCRQIEVGDAVLFKASREQHLENVLEGWKKAIKI